MDSRRIKQISQVFEQHFATSPKRWFQAPGRVNLIGEHTDYNDGFVLPCAIDYQTIVAVRPRSDTLVRVVAMDYDNQLDEFDLSQQISADPERLWCNYIRGVVKHLIDDGQALGGVDLVVSGNVPQGAGLSSSASLEVAIGETFRQLHGLSISSAQVALNGQAAENQFVGCNCGIMDQMVSACGAEHHAVLLDCRTLAIELISMPSELSVVIINSNVKRGLVDSEYNTRREQCEQAAQVLGLKALRDISLVELESRRSELEEIVYKRARHVVSENERTLKAAQALKQGDIKTLSALMAQSHQAMRDDFEITVEQIDFMVATLADYLGDKGGVRMTGGGFGGCVVALMPHAMIEGAQQLLAKSYEAHTGIKETVYICTASDGAGEFIPES